MMNAEVPVDYNIFANFITTKVLTPTEQREIADYEAKLVRERTPISNVVFDLMKKFPIVPNRPNDVVRRNDRVKFLKMCLRSWTEPIRSDFTERFKGFSPLAIPSATTVKIMLERDPDLLERWELDPVIQFENTYKNPVTKQEEQILNIEQFYVWFHREIIRLRNYLSVRGYTVGFEYLGEVPEDIKVQGWDPSSKQPSKVSDVLLGKRPFNGMPHKEAEKSYEHHLETQLENLLGEVENIIYTKSGDPKFWNGRIEVKKKIWDAWINPAVSFYRGTMNTNSIPLPYTPMELVENDIAKNKKNNMIVYDSIPLCKMVIKFDKNYDMQQNRINLWLKCTIVGKFDMKQSEHIFFLIGKKRLLAPDGFIEKHCSTLKDTEKAKEQLKKIRDDYKESKDIWQAYRSLIEGDPSSEIFGYGVEPGQDVVGIEIFDPRTGQKVTGYMSREEYQNRLSNLSRDANDTLPPKPPTPAPARAPAPGTVANLTTNPETDEMTETDEAQQTDETNKAEEVPVIQQTGMIFEGDLNVLESRETGFLYASGARETMQNFETTGIEVKMKELSKAIRKLENKRKQLSTTLISENKIAKGLRILEDEGQISVAELKKHKTYVALPSSVRRKLISGEFVENLQTLKTEIVNRISKTKSDISELVKEKVQLKNEQIELENIKKQLEKQTKEDEIEPVPSKVIFEKNLVPTMETVFYIKIRTFSTNSNKIQFSWGTKYGFWDSVYKLLPKVKMQKNIYQSLENYNEYKNRILGEVLDRLDVLTYSANFRITGFGFSADDQKILADWSSNIDTISHKSFESSNDMYKTLTALKTCQAWFFGKKNDLQETSKQRLVRYLDKDKKDLKKIGHFFGADMDYNKK